MNAIQILLSSLGINPEDFVKRGDEIKTLLQEFIRNQEQIAGRQEEMLARLVILEMKISSRSFGVNVNMLDTDALDRLRIEWERNEHEQ